MQTKRIKRQVHGVLLLDKPLGLSSNQALQRVKYLFQAAKAGHTGSLDPLATGLLPLCFGEATKFSHFLLDADKSYRAVVNLGSTTTTGDAEGEILSTQPVTVTEEEVEKVVSQFIGSIQQVPPMYSALKHEGKALYEYARAGVEIARASRQVVIHSITFNGFSLDPATLDLTVSCSKGTYIRTLAEDIGQALGCGAHLASLRRLASAHFDLADALTIDDLEQKDGEQRDQSLLPIEAAVGNLPEVELDETSAFYLMQGQRVWKSGALPAGLFRLYNPLRQFMGLGEMAEDGSVAPKRLLANI